ncbi:MAG: hypothetical protein ACOYM0_05895 [Bacteroidales bacterium]
MKYLLSLNIVFILLLTACDPVKKSQLSPSGKGSFKIPEWSSPFLKGFEKALFHTSLDVAGKHLSGISIIKRTSDTSFHFTFANEIGMTYLDMEVFRKTYKADYIFEALNRKSFLKVLWSDFSMMLFSSSERKPVRMYLDNESEESVYFFLRQSMYTWINTKEMNLTRLVGWSNYFDAVMINFSEYDAGFPSEIKISNPRIRMVLTFSLLGH